MNLLNDPWVPVRLADGSVVKLTPAQVPTSGAVCVAHARADFSALITEMLVCIFQTLSCPATEDERVDLLDGQTFPDLDLWPQFANAFELSGDAACFMQAPEYPVTDGQSKVEAQPAAALLYEFPAGNTVKLNKDFFTARGQAEPLCPHCAPVALFLNQSHARMGGNGYRTGPRESSVMTALLRSDTLWHTICLNLLPATWFEGVTFDDDNSDIASRILKSLPWMQPERYLGKKAAVSLSAVGLFGSLWWMPVALRLKLEQNPEAQACFTCGEVHPEMCFTTTKRATPAYLEGDSRHPHTGWFTTKKTGQGRCTEVPSEGFTFEHWQSLTVGATREKGLPAWEQLDWQDADAARLWVFGYQMNNMSPGYWLDETAPLVHLQQGPGSAEPAENARENMRAFAGELVESLQKTVKALNASLYFDPKKVTPKNPAPRLVMSRENAMQALWQRLSVQAIRAVKDASLTGNSTAAAREALLPSLRQSALHVFDRAVDDACEQPSVAIVTLKRRVKLIKTLTPVVPKASKPSKTPK